MPIQLSPPVLRWVANSRSTMLQCPLSVAAALKVDQPSHEVVCSSKLAVVQSMTAPSGLVVLYGKKLVLVGSGAELNPNKRDVAVDVLGNDGERVVAVEPDLASEEAVTDKDVVGEDVMDELEEVLSDDDVANPAVPLSPDIVFNTDAPLSPVAVGNTDVALSPVAVANTDVALSPVAVANGDVALSPVVVANTDVALSPVDAKDIVGRLRKYVEFIGGVGAGSGPLLKTVEVPLPGMPLTGQARAFRRPGCCPGIGPW